jgi:DNA helicase-2/ATP-dependent DNA helicase PcrA
MADLFENLDPDQSLAVRAIRGPVCIIAGAGTGKTRTITHRIAYAIQSGVTDPSKVLALTFTSKAAQEMRMRLRALGIPNVNARTFHSAAMRQLLYFWPSVVGSPFPQLLPNKSAALAEAIRAANLPIYPNAATVRDLAGEIEWAKVQEIDPIEYVETAKANNRLYGDKNKIEIFSKAYQEYENMKVESGVIDFDDLLVLTVGMIEEERTVRERIRDQYRYFTVDEYQDVSPLQQKLLNLWLGNRDEICVVGDAAQTIYSFSGATNNFLLSFNSRYPEAQVFRLNRGYRSTPEIIRVATQILDSGTTQYGHALISNRKSGVKPAIYNSATYESEASLVAEKIADYINEGVHPTEIAVLARTNNQLELFDKKLVSIGIETDGATTIASRDGERFFERTDVREAIRDIRVASVLSEPGSDWLAELRGLLQPYTSTRFHKSFLYLATQMSEEVKVDEKGDTRLSLRSFLREIEDRAAQNNPPTYPGVHLGTVHSAKGLEWPIVFLIGVSDQYFPYQNPWSTASSSTPASKSSEHNSQIEEERRLLYVGLTRAQQVAHLSYVGNPSPFIEGWKKSI